MHAEIIFYSANGCGFCVKAKQMLKDLIASGKIMVKDAKEAPKGVRGFPFFESVSKKGKTHTGLPPSAAALMQKLGPSPGPGIPPPTPVGPIPQCVVDQDCEQTQKCVKGRCTGAIPVGPIPQCVVDQDCKPNQKCVNGACVTQSTPFVYKAGLTTADIVGIVIASVAGVALIVALGFLIAKASKKGKKGRKSRK